MNTIMKDSILKKILGFSLGTWISAVATFILMPIITRTIVPSDLGRIDLFVTFCMIFIYASTLGMHQSLLRFYREPPKGFNRNTLFAFAIKVAIMGTFFVGVFSCFLNEYFSTSILGYTWKYLPLFIFLYVLSNVFLDIAKTVPRLEGNVIQYTVIVVIVSVGLKVTYLSYKIFGNIEQTVACIALVIFAVMMVYVIKFRKSIFITTSHLPVQSKINILKYALPTVPVMFISNFNTSIPKLMLNQYSDSHSLGMYAAAGTLVSIIHLVQTGVNVFWAPYVFENYIEKQEEIQRAHLLVSFVIVLCGILLICFQDIVFLIFGETYRGSKNFYAFLLASPVFYTIGETVGIGISIAKKTYWNIATTGAAVIVNLVLCYLLVPQYGNIGAAISVMSSAFVMLFIKGVLGERFYKIITSYKKTLSLPVLYVIASVVSCILVNAFFFRLIILVFLIMILLMICRDEAYNIWLLGKKLVKH